MDRFEIRNFVSSPLSFAPGVARYRARPAATVQAPSLWAVPWSELWCLSSLMVPAGVWILPVAFWPWLHFDLVHQGLFLRGFLVCARWLIRVRAVVCSVWGCGPSARVDTIGRGDEGRTKTHFLFLNWEVMCLRLLAFSVDGRGPSVSLCWADGVGGCRNPRWQPWPSGVVHVPVGGGERELESDNCSPIPDALPGTS